MAKLLSGTSVYGNINIQTYVSAAGNVLAGNVSTAGNVTAGNVLFDTGIVSGTGNIYAGNLSVSGLVTVASTTGNSISTAGNIAAGYLFGNGALLTGIDVGPQPNICLLYTSDAADE